MKLPRSALWFAAGIVLTATLGAIAAQTNYLGVVFVADPTTPSQQMTVNSDGSININGSGHILTFLGSQTLTAATLASTTTLTVPATATIADFYPECSTGGTDNQCIRFNPNGSANATTSAGVASQQLLLGYTGPLSTTQVILATGATGASGNTLVVYYYK